MKRFSTYAALAGVIVCLSAASTAHAQGMGRSSARPSPKASVMSTLGSTTITVVYSRPGVKGRTIYGDLVPYDQVWRAGANEVTTVEFSADVTVNGKALKAGKYGLHMLPRENGTWTAIFTDQPAVWGIPYQEGHDVLRVDTMARKSPVKVEWLMYTFRNLKPEVPTSGELVLSWDMLEVPLTITTGGM